MCGVRRPQRRCYGRTKDDRQTIGNFRAPPIIKPERMEAAAETDADAADDESAAFVRFLYRSRWFVLAQTEGEATAAVAPSLPAIRRNTP